MPDSVLINWRAHPDTVFGQHEVNPSCQSFLGIITNLSPGDTVTYYLEAHDQNTSVRFSLVAPKSGYTFWHDINTGPGTFEPNLKARIFPNPGNGSFRFDLNALNYPVNISIYSPDGRLVHIESVLPGALVRLPGNIHDGYYEVRWISGSNSGVNKLLIQR